MSILSGIKFDEHEVIGGIEVDARLLVSACTKANTATAPSAKHAVECAETEAVAKIRRQLYGHIEDALRAELSLFESLDTEEVSVESLQSAIVVGLKRVLEKVR